MSKIFYTNIDLKKNQLEYARIHNVTEFPSSPVVGQIVYLTAAVSGYTANNLYMYNGTDWVCCVKKGNITGGNEILIGSAADTATGSGITIANSTTGLAPSSDTTVPTSKAVADYVGSLAGGITYKGTIGDHSGDTVSSLPTTDVHVGDAYAVTTAGTYTPLTDPSAVGDLIICNGVNGSTVSWTNVPVNFTVDNKDATVPVGGSTSTEIAVIDGKSVTMKVGGITASDSGTGNVVTGVSATGNAITVTKGNVFDNLSGTANNGVVTNIAVNASDATQIDITSESLLTSALSNNHYVSNIEQAANGKITATGATFDASIPSSNPATNNAPTTSAVKTYVDTAIQGLDADVTSDDAAVATVQVVEENGVITDVVVANVSAGVTYTAPSGQTGPNITASTATGAVTGADIATIKNYVDALAGGGISALDVTGYAQAAIDTTTTGQTTITIKGIEENDGLIGASTNDTDIDIVVDGTYDASTNKVASVSTVTNAIADLDVSAFAQASIANSAAATTEGGTFTVNGISETDGEIATDATTNKTTLTAGRGLSIYNATIGHTNSYTASTNPIGRWDDTYHIQTIVTELEWDAYGHITGVSEQNLLASNIACNPVITGGSQNVQGALGDLQNEITSMANGMIYKGAWSSHTQGTTVDKVGDTYTYDGNSSTMIDSQTVEPGDTIIISAVDGSSHMSHIVVLERNVTGSVTTADTLTSDKLVLGNGSQAVKTSTYGITSTAVAAGGAGTNTDILTSDAVVTTIANKLSNLDGTATIASQSGDVVTIKTGVTQTNGEISNDGGTDIVFEEVAITGAAADVSIADAGSLITATNVEDALQELASAISSASITIDGHKGAITTGNGLTDVAADGGSFGINIDSNNDNGLYLSGSTEGSKQLAMHIADESTTSGANFGTVKVTNGNGLTISSGVISYAHNTTAITVASESNGVVTINGTLTPDASDAITTSDSITLAKVATTGAAADVSIADSGSVITATNVEDALQELASRTTASANVFSGSKAVAVGGTMTITLTPVTGGSVTALTDAAVSVRDSSGNEVECDKAYGSSGATITLTFYNNSSETFYAVVTTKNNVASITVS